MKTREMFEERRRKRLERQHKADAMMKRRYQKYVERRNKALAEQLEEIKKAAREGHVFRGTKTVVVGKDEKDSWTGFRLVCDKDNHEEKVGIFTKGAPIPGKDCDLSEVLDTMTLVEKARLRMGKEEVEGRIRLGGLTIIKENNIY